MEHKTLAEIIVNRKCRKGTADGTTSAGAYWVALQVDICRAVGSGIGQEPSSCNTMLQVRHFRDGDIQAWVLLVAWHQGSGTDTQRFRCDKVLSAVNDEDLAQILRSTVLTDEDGNKTRVYVSSDGETRLKARIPELAKAPAGPDETAVETKS